MSARLETKRPFERICIVNRGEPALRLIHAVRERVSEGAKYKTIALFTAADRSSSSGISSGESPACRPRSHTSQRPSGPGQGSLAVVWETPDQTTVRTRWAMTKPVAARVGRARKP